MKAFLFATRYTFGSRLSGMGALVGNLSIVGLMVGTGVLIAVLAVMNGFDRELKTRILTYIPHIRVISSDGIEHWQADARLLRQDADVIAVSPYLEVTGLLRFRSEVAPVIATAIDPRVEIENAVLTSQLGVEVLQQMEQQQRVFLGVELAQKLQVSEGDMLSFMVLDQGLPRLASFPFGGTFSTSTELDHRLVLLPIEMLQAAGLAPLANAGMRIHTQRLFEAASHAYQLLAELPPGYRATTWASSHGNLFEAIQMSRYLVGLIVFLLLGIAAFNVLGSLMITTADRQSDMAILKTLGAQGPFLMRIFLLQGLIIGVIGAVSGIVLGWVLTLGLSPAVSGLEKIFSVQFLQSNVYPLDYLPVHLIWSQALLVALVAILLSVLGAIYPAWRVLRVPPAETLRY